ncbi:ATP-dependent nuclease, subunit B [Enhygromyxa salina]|uniref:ATP-dependent nuclease, subunit B n=1 Tax=Enhygromyxa salina TaxID=215803 RepID=A0A0C1ZFG6_9BACT|nr:ATP-dependent nuclease, subunit B [Enhygromyxa salina]
MLPTRDRVAEHLRERVRAQGVALALGVIDLRSLEDRLIRATQLNPIGTTESRLVVSAVAPDAARGTTLAELATQPGFAESFLELWDTLRRAGIDRLGFERLATQLSRRPDSLSGRRFTALARIATAYEARLHARGALDGVAARVRLPRAISELGRHRLASLVDGARVIEVERNPELPVIRARMWEALARAGLDVTVEVPVLPPGDDDVAPELVGALELLRRNLVEEAPSVDLRPMPLLHDNAKLAAAGLIPFVPPSRARALVSATVRNKLELIDAEDERAALRGVSAAIRELLHEGVAPHRVTIAVPRLGLARHRVLAALDAAELPCEETRGQPVLQAAPLRLTLALIDAAERELPREALAGVLESAYVARRDTTALLSALREAGSRDNRGIGHLGRLRAHADKLARQPPAPFGAAPAEPPIDLPPAPPIDPFDDPFDALLHDESDQADLPDHPDANGVPPFEHDNHPSNADSVDEDPHFDEAPPFDEDTRFEDQEYEHATNSAEAPPTKTDPARAQQRRNERAARYHQLADRWQRLFAKLRLRRSATLREHLDAVFAALRALGIPRRCLALPELGDGTRERRLERDAVAALARDRAALEALEAAGHGLDDAAAAVGVADAQVSLTDFRAHLEAALAGVRERPAGVSGAGIAVRDLVDLSRSPSDYVFVIHAVEGELPGSGRVLPFLDDEDRQALDRAAGRPVLGTPTAADAGTFALACAGVRERLVLAAHRHDADGREVMRSRYFAALAVALGHDHPPRTLDAGVVPSFSQASTRGQLLTRMSMLAREGRPVATRRDKLGTGELERALDWALGHAHDLARAGVHLPEHSRALALTRLDFNWTGQREAAPGLVWQGSATSLEDYAACPFRFFAQRVLRVRPPPSIRDELDAAEQGSVRHLVLAEVMQALRDQGLTPLEGGDRTGHENRLAREVCEAVLDRWQHYERTGPLPLWYLHRDLVVRDLSRTLEGERRFAIEAWEPGEFEIGFGVPSEAGDGTIEGVPLAILDRDGARRFELVGRVDRIDYRGDGREREGLIIDYKSGRVGDRMRFDQLARTQLQLPLYAAWLATRRPDLGDADAAYVSLRDGERSQASLLDLCLSSIELDGLLALDPNERRDLRARAANELPAPNDPATEPQARVGPPDVAAGALDLPEIGQRNLADNVWALLGGVAEGRFDVRPHDPGRACRYCSFGPVCRVERGDELDEGDT